MSKADHDAQDTATPVAPTPKPATRAAIVKWAGFSQY